jgi:hypothetical protein
VVRRVQRHYEHDGMIVPACNICGEPAHARLVGKPGRDDIPTCYGCIAEFAVPTGKRRKLMLFWPVTFGAFMLGAVVFYTAGELRGREHAPKPLECPSAAPVAPVIIAAPAPATSVPPDEPASPPLPADPGVYGAAPEGSMRPWRHPVAPPFEKQNAMRAVDALKRVSAREGAREVCRAQGGIGIDRGPEIVCKFPGVDEHGWADEAAVEGWRLRVDQ